MNEGSARYPYEGNTLKRADDLGADVRRDARGEPWNQTKSGLAPTPTTPSEIDAELDDLRRSLEHLAVSLESLQTRLWPVLRESREVAGKAPVETQAGSPLANAIRQHRQVAEHSVVITTNLHERLCL